MVRAGAFMGGATLAVLLLVSVWRVPVGDRAFGAEVRASASPTGELGVEPAGPILTATGLRAGGPRASGWLDVRNQTGKELSVHVVLDASTHDLDGMLSFRVQDRDDVITEGIVGRASGEAAPARLVLTPGERRHLRLSVWVPEATADVDGRSVDLDVRLVVTDPGPAS